MIVFFMKCFNRGYPNETFINCSIYVSKYHPYDTKMLQIQFDSNDTFGSVCLKEKQNNFMIPFILISEELRAYGGETELNFKHMNRKNY